MRKTLHIIPHSHWDREWYLPFEKHRIRLVELMDDLIETMELDPDYKAFHLDGQYIVLEDYLEIRPQMKERLLALIRADRIQIGPWYVLQDEYLTSGEANVRNMLYGIRLCKALGAKPVETGYFPDAFGNISQAPQIIRGFGFDTAVFGRGVNDIGADNALIRQKGLSGSELIWRSPDGSEVAGVMFSNWYHNAMELPDDPEALKARIAQIVADAEPRAATDHLLGMNGCDHQPLQKNLSQVIRLANEVQENVRVVHSNFRDYLELIKQSQAHFPVFEGEINGQLSAGACPLVNTASSHIDIKQANHRTQHLLERIAEPLATLDGMVGGVYDKDYFLYAWKPLMQNHPHDSICSCSCDEIYTEMLTRFQKATSCGEALRDRALEHLAASCDTSAVDGERAILIFSLEPNEALQSFSVDVDYDPAEAPAAITIFGKDGNAIPAKITRSENVFTYTLPRDSFRKPRYVTRFHAELQLWTHGIGCQAFAVRPVVTPLASCILCNDRSMENKFLSVCFNVNGTVDITDKRTGRVFAGQNLFEDTKDIGNLYNYIQTPGDIPVTNRDAEAEIRLYEETPYSVTFEVKVPLGIDADITSYVTLPADAARVDFRTVIENRGENHRLRALFPTDIDTDTVLAEGQFDLVAREITPAPTWKNPCYTQRVQAFISLESPDGKDGLLLANRGLPEYEILRDGRNTAAITLLRCVGEIGDWGVFPTPLGQKKGTYTLEYSFAPHCTDTRGEALNLGYSFAALASAAVATDIHSGSWTPNSAIFSCDNPYIRMSAMKRAEDSNAVILRLFSIHTEQVDVKLALSSSFTSAARANLAETEEEALSIENSAIHMTIPAKKIVTIALK